MSAPASKANDRINLLDVETPKSNFGDKEDEQKQEIRPAPIKATSSSATPATPTGPLELSLVLHHAVFRNDITELNRLIALHQYDLNAVDAYGNTAMHIACMLHHVECVQALVAAGAKISIKNKIGFTPINEATSIGDRAVLKLLWQTYKTRARESQELSGFLSHLTAIPDFRVTFQWKVESWLPFIGRFLPYDSVTLSKKGNSVRVDTNMLEFKAMKWYKHPFSFLLKPKQECEGIMKKSEEMRNRAASGGRVTSPESEASAAAAASSASASASASQRQPFLVFTLDHELKKWQCISTDSAEREAEEKRQRETRERYEKEAKARKAERTPKKQRKQGEEVTPSASPIAKPDMIRAASASAAVSSPVAAVAASSSAAPAAPSSSSTHDDIDLAYELDDFQSAPITSTFSPGRLTFTPIESMFSLSSWTFGMFGSVTQKIEQVHSWQASVWKVSNIRLHTHKRMEHLTEEERKNMIERGNKMKELLSKPTELTKHLEEEAMDSDEDVDGPIDVSTSESDNDDEHQQEGVPTSAAAAAAADDASTKSSSAPGGTKRAHHRRSSSKLPPHRTSLPLPPKTNIKFATYFSALNQTAYTAVDAEEQFDRERDEEAMRRVGAEIEEIIELEEKKDGADGSAPSASSAATPSAPRKTSSAAAPSSSSSSSTPHPSSSPDLDAPYLHLGRPMIQHVSKKKYSAKLWMSQSFPLSMRTVIHVVDLLFGTSYPQATSKFKHFVTQELPAGFPVRAHLPIFPSISADLAISDFREGDDIEYTSDNPSCSTNDEETFFQIPPGYAREEETEEEQHRRQQRYRRRWKAGQKKTTSKSRTASTESQESSQARHEE